VSGEGIRAGVLARMPAPAGVMDTNHWLAAVIGLVNPADVSGDTRYTLRLLKRVAGTVTQLGSKVVLSEGYTSAITRRIKLTVDASGNAAVYLASIGTDNWGAALITATDTDLASAGPLNDGRVGLYDAFFVTPVNWFGGYERRYDNFSAMTPTTTSNIYPACYPSQSVEFRSDSAERENAAGTGWGDIPSYRGANFFIPPAGSSGRVTRVVAKARRADVNDYRDAIQADANIADSTSLAVRYTPRYLVIPRS
jgi:hypothetical protein